MPAVRSAAAWGKDHMAFYLKLEHNGKDLYPDLRKVMRNNLSNNNVNSPFFGIQTLHPASDLHPSLTTDYKE